MFNTEIHKWISSPTFENELIKPINPNLLSYENNCLYLIGGKTLINDNSNSPSANGKYFQHHDFRSGRWTQLPKLIHAHSQSASYIHDGTVYVSGGEDQTYETGYIECFDINAGKWREFEASMPKPKMNHTLLIHNDHLWFFGGKKYTSSNSFASIAEDLTWYSYDMNEHTWSHVHSLPASYGKFKTQKILDVVIEV